MLRKNATLRALLFGVTALGLAAVLVVASLPPRHRRGAAAAVISRRRGR